MDKLCVIFWRLCQSWSQFLAQNSFRRWLKRGLLLTPHFLVKGHCSKFTKPEKNYVGVISSKCWCSQSPYISCISCLESLDDCSLLPYLPYCLSLPFPACSCPFMCSFLLFLGLFWPFLNFFNGILFPLFLPLLPFLANPTTEKPLQATQKTCHDENQWNATNPEKEELHKMKKVHGHSQWWLI